jgi:tetratricopeptide (TPR) repeat protein
MEQGFIDILKQVAKEQGKETFLDLKKCRATVSDYTKADYRNERGMLLRAVEEGVSNALFSVEIADIDNCMKAQQHVLCEEQFMDNAIAWNIVFILAYVLRDITIKEIKTEVGSNEYEEAMGFYYDEQFDKAIPLLETLAGKGHIGAQYALGFCYRQGQGVTPDQDKGRELILKAAEQGYAKAQLWIGRSYIGVKSDYAKALEWFQKAADQGDANAQAEIGDLYFGGYGVTEDKAKAAEWYKKAAEGYQKRIDQGDAKAQKMLDKLKKAGKI